MVIGLALNKYNFKQKKEMDKLFGTSKKKEEAPPVDINAPTLKETSENVSTQLICL